MKKFLILLTLGMFTMGFGMTQAFAEVSSDGGQNIKTGQESLKNGLKNGAKDGMKYGVKDGQKEGLKYGLKDGLKNGLKNGQINGEKKAK